VPRFLAKRPYLLGVIILVLGLLGIARLTYQTNEGLWLRCENQNPELSIPACSMLIALDRETDENRAIAYYNRAIAHRDKRDFAQALGDVNQAIEIDPARSDSYYLRGRIRAAQREYRAAIADYDHALALTPGFADALRYRGLARRTLGDIAGGDADLERARTLGAEIEN
jgi:tetratricopeptide (TPR) repeat protein